MYRLNTHVRSSGIIVFLHAAFDCIDFSPCKGRIDERVGTVTVDVRFTKTHAEPIVSVIGEPLVSLGGLSRDVPGFCWVGVENDFLLDAKKSVRTYHVSRQFGMGR